MKIPDWLPCYGDTKYRGDCPKETAEQITFFSKLRREYPDCLGIIAVHPRNEQLLRGGQFSALAKHKAEGMSTGASDILIPGSPSFVCELKRLDHTKSKWQDGQLSYLEAAHNKGAFVCVALGWESAWQALIDWQAMGSNTVHRKRA